MVTKTVTITPAVLQYEGDAIGRDFVFVLLINGQNYLYRSFRQKIGHGESITIIGQSLGLHLSFDELERKLHIPIAVMAAELDPSEKEPASRFLGASTTDFGMNAAILSFEFTEGYHYPHTFVFELPVAVQGDFWAEKGKEKHKTAQLKLLIDVEVNWDMTQMETGNRVLMEYQAGRRSFNGEMLQEIKLPNVFMPGVDFGEANLLWANFENANLYGSDFKLSIFRGVHALLANLERCNFLEANVSESIFDEANLCYADFSEAQLNSSFINCQAVSTNFSEAQIHATNFRGADLAGALFQGAKLDYVDFRNANLNAADFTGAKIGKINYEGADISATIGLENVPSTNFDPVDPFEGKSEDYRKGYTEGYERGYTYAIGQTKYDENAWKKSLNDNLLDYSSDFEEGYKVGFLQTYKESWANAHK